MAEKIDSCCVYDGGDGRSRLWPSSECAAHFAMTRTSLLLRIESSDERERVSSSLALGPWSMLDAVPRGMVRRRSALNRVNGGQIEQSH